MRPAWWVKLVIGAILCVALPTSAKLVPISEEELEAGRAEAAALFDRGDVEGLVALLDEAHLFIKTEAALHLGRLGARTAVERLIKLDEQYSRFDCAPSGQFRVAIILIENGTAEEEKNALLHVATQEPGDAAYVHSVIDAAGRELSRYEGVDIVERLLSVNTYGAQYAVIAHRCRGLAPDEAITWCVAILAAHDTPMTAEAAQELLISFGPAAGPPVRALRDRVAQRIAPTDAPYTIDRTIAGRCDRILREIGVEPEPEPVPEPSIDRRARGEAGREIDDLIAAATTRPWPGDGYPALPALSTEMRGRIGDEIAGSDRVRAAYGKLDAARRDNAEWFEGVAQLEAEGAAWCLTSCVVHPHEDVQIHALRALERIGDRRVVPFLLVYAEYMAVLEGGSESATIHGIVQSSVAKTLSALTGVRVEISGQDPEGLRAAITKWRRWLVDHPDVERP
jgi:hypothetical protein